MNQLSLALLVLVIFGAYIIDAREAQFKVTCPGTKEETGIWRKGFKNKYGTFLVTGCCKQGQELKFVGGYVFCCKGTARCTTGRWGECKCNDKVVSNTITAEMTVIKVVS